LISQEALSVSREARCRSPTQPQGCEPCEDTPSEWGTETCNERSVRPKYKKTYPSTDEGGQHNKQHLFSSELLQIKPDAEWLQQQQPRLLVLFSVAIHRPEHARGRALTPVMMAPIPMAIYCDKLQFQPESWMFVSNTFI
jgi:hypothetical protein